VSHGEPENDRAGRVSTLELFFDLVFVFTLTQLTALLADEADLAGLVKVVLLLSLIWWMYDGYAWLTNALALDVLGHRLLLLGGMGGFLVIALAIPTTFEGGGVAFGVGYLGVVVLHGGLYIRETSVSEARAIRGIVPYNLIAALLLVAGGLAGGEAQWILVVAAAVLLWCVPLLVSLEGFQISASHFVERHALVVIVALGESIVVLGVGAGGAEVGLELALIALLGLSLSAALWWTYFGEENSIEEAMLSAPSHERPRLAIVFGYLHIFLLLGIVLVATGLKKAIPDPLDPLDDAAAVVLAAGTALFVAADTAFLRVLGIAHGPARAAAAVAALATIPLGMTVSAVAQVAALAAIVVLALVAGRGRATLVRP
jgi:low temperature requirement protein LtrA